MNDKWKKKRKMEENDFLNSYILNFKFKIYQYFFDQTISIISFIFSPIFTYL